jgi:hypothetical protein
MVPDHRSGAEGDDVPSLLDAPAEIDVVSGR